MQLIIIEGEQCKTKEDLFKTFSKELHFPDYFSDNWDSFEEIINDLNQFNENFDGVVITDWDKICEESELDKEIFTDIILQANENNEYQFYRT